MGAQEIQMNELERNSTASVGVSTGFIIWVLELDFILMKLFSSLLISILPTQHFC
jgi:hypothetical protein